MSRKTNKTTHVLNLLSNGVKKPEDGAAEESTEKVNKPEEEKEVRAEKQAEKESGEKVPGVSVVRRGSDSVAEAVKASLEAELRTEEEQRARETNRAANLKNQKKEIKKEQKAGAEAPASSADEEAEEKTEAASSGPSGAEAPAAAKAEEQKEPEDDFVTVNVMERLVKERAPRYIKQFHLCECSRCLADVTALALTGLPAKYVVINRNAVSPLMNFYTVKYAGIVTVEVTKACMTVQANPHHDVEKK